MASTLQTRIRGVGRLYCEWYSVRRVTEHHKTPSTHTQEQTQYRRLTVKEHGHHWDSQQDFSELENVINFNKSILTIFSPSVSHT
jgi:hypothetical protein